MYVETQKRYGGSINVTYLNIADWLSAVSSMKSHLQTGFRKHFVWVKVWGVAWRPCSLVRFLHNDLIRRQSCILCLLPFSLTKFSFFLAPLIFIWEDASSHQVVGYSVLPKFCFLSCTLSLLKMPNVISVERDYSQSINKR